MTAIVTNPRTARLLVVLMLLLAAVLAFCDDTEDAEYVDPDTPEASGYTSGYPVRK